MKLEKLDSEDGFKPMISYVFLDLAVAFRQGWQVGPAPVPQAINVPW
jgi:hypothetical protein